MNNVCDNADNFASTTRGASLHPVSNVPNNKYGYDFSIIRKDRKRDRVCPSPAWARRPENACPATLAQAPFRSDKLWWTPNLEPGTTINQIANKRSLATGQVTINSGIRYTCDEFPPASWVEGGNGVYGTSAGTTRCAAARCSPGINAEQDCTQSQIFFNSSIPQFLKITTDPQRHRARLFTSKITYCAGGSGQSKYCAGGWPVRPIEQCRLLPLSNVLRIRLQGC
jgi:hypothetical protein